ncbi:MAG TPA: histidine phosphatase family protein [Acidimicrobiales bacterium]|nr:histidine phosphatase family protein [Acidimicrobiales bacterium]
MATDVGRSVSEGPRQYRQLRFSLPANATEVVLVRHGETVPAVDGTLFDLVDGHGDPELGPEGHLQAEKVAARLAGEEPDAIYVTNLRRTAETAAPLAARLGLEPRVEADLREVLLGEWEGGAYRRHLVDGHPLALELIEKERWDVIPGAESNEAFQERLRRGISRIAAAHVGRRVVAVSHGGAIGMILSMATGSRPFAFVGADNGSISRLIVSGGNWSVRGFNEVSHLD